MGEPAAIADRLALSLAQARTVEHVGRIKRATGISLTASGLHARIGQPCLIESPGNGPAIRAEVVGFIDGLAVLTPLDRLTGLHPDATVRPLAGAETISFGDGLLGRTLDSFCRPLDGLGPLPTLADRTPLYAEAPPPLQRPLIARPMPTGVRALDGLLTFGEGQRVGLFAAAGVGKSTLLGMIARGCTADINIIALIGERGREVREFLEDSLGLSGLGRSVIVVATADRPAMERVRAAHVATAIAEGFRARGSRVLLLMDSVTRFARALREIGLAAGEPAVRRGLPPSVFAELPRLFERAGLSQDGAITGFYTVLAEDDEDTDPVSEEVRSLLDGHIVLSRAMAQSGRYPAIDVLASVSRVFNRITGPEQAGAARRMLGWIRRRKDVDLLLKLGEYQRGEDADTDEAIDRFDQIEAFLSQPTDHICSFDETLRLLEEISG